MSITPLSLIVLLDDTPHPATLRLLQRLPHMQQITLNEHTYIAAYTPTAWPALPLKLKQCVSNSAALLPWGRQLKTELNRFQHVWFIRTGQLHSYVPQKEPSYQNLPFGQLQAHWQGLAVH